MIVQDAERTRQVCSLSLVMFAASRVRYNGVVASISVTQQSIDQAIPAKGVAVLDFWAAWCRPCSQFSPVFSAVADKFPDLAFLTINTDQEQELARRFAVQSLPTVVILVDSLVAFRRPGVMTARELERIVQGFVELAAQRA